MNMVALLSLLAIYGVPLGIAFGLGAYVAWQARRRGYSFWVWLLASVVSLNPLLILILLAMLPDARKKRLREEEMEALQEKIAALPVVELGGDAVVPAGSLGEQSTAAARLRSVGDEETRG
jgi:heme exporter protein D